MGIFGRGEGYSREKYDEAEKDLRDKTESAFRHTPEAVIHHGVPRSAIDLALDDHRIAKERLASMMKKGEKEGRELNAEYDRLWKKAQEALDALAKFETEKLGMGHIRMHGSNPVQEERDYKGTVYRGVKESRQK